MTYPVRLGKVKIEDRSLSMAPTDQQVLSNGVETTYVGSDSVVPNNNSSRFPLEPDLGVRAFFNVIVQEVQ